tara:strand:+ start:830 stop:1057 length:228 start_codon:yes stop_codon:yes gene_type:complete
MNKKFYETIYDCIVTGQVSSDRIAKYLKDKGFYKYWQKRKEEEEEIYGQKEQRELDESMKEAFRQRDERKKRENK